MPRPSQRRSRPVPGFKSHRPFDPSRRGHLLSLSDVQASGGQGISSIVQQVGNRVVNELQHTLNRSVSGMARRWFRSCWQSMCLPENQDQHAMDAHQQEGSPPVVSSDDAMPTRRRRRSRREAQDDHPTQQQQVLLPQGPAYGYPTQRVYIPPSTTPQPTLNTTTNTGVAPPPTVDIQVENDTGLATVTPSSVDPVYPPVALEGNDDYYNVSPMTASFVTASSSLLAFANTPNPSFLYRPSELDSDMPTEFQPPG